MSFIARRPAEGTPALLHTGEEVARAADALGAGHGPIAIDVERAGAYLFRDEACLVQLRREGAGSFLLDPLRAGQAIENELAPVLNDAEWILHSATSDLPSLFDLGLRPAALFDTELAGRFGGFERVNLAALVDEFCGVTLLKQHGNENWSVRPLPQSWLNYAALDVEYLIPLADGLREDLDASDKLDWFYDECDYIVDRYRHGDPHPTKQWSDTKGISRLKKRKSLQIARLLWQRRFDIARDRNIAVSRVLKDKTLVAIAEQAPRSYQQLKRVPFYSEQVRQHASVWLDVVRDVEQQDPAGFPSRAELRSAEELPDVRALKNQYPDTWESMQDARDMVYDLGRELEIPAENILKPAILKTTIWEARDGGVDIARALTRRGARRWQVELTAPIIAEALGF